MSLRTSSLLKWYERGERYIGRRRIGKRGRGGGGVGGRGERVRWRAVTDG
jgi:hypothetical protein